MLGITDRTVRDLARRGVLPKAGDGLYPIRASVTAYCAHLRESAAGRSGGGGPASASLTSQRARLVTEQADKVELANAITRSELIEASAVEREWSSILSALRARMLAVPSRVHQRLGHLTAGELATIDREVRDALTELGTGGANIDRNPENPALGGA